MVAGGRAKTRLYGRRRRRRNSSSRNHGGIVGPSFPPRFSYLFLFSVMRTYVGLPLRERRNDEKGMETDVTEGGETREPHKFCPLPRMGKSRSSGDIFVLPSRISVHRLYFHFEPLQIDAKKREMRGFDLFSTSKDLEDVNALRFSILEPICLHDRQIRFFDFLFVDLLNLGIEPFWIFFRAKNSIFVRAYL